MPGRPVLAIDIGNSNLTATLVRDGAPGEVRRAVTERDATPERVATIVAGLAEELAGADGAGAELAGIVAASVVPSATAGLRHFAERHGLPLLLATHATVPIPIRVDRPETVGPDRLVNAYAAGRRYGTPCIVLDFGTATTLDVVGVDGAYLGGPIAPGLELGLEALASRTALLPRVELRLPERAIATETVGAIQAGAVLGHREMAAGLLRLVRAELAAATGRPAGSMRAVATGGLSAAPWAAAIPGVDAVDPLLTLRGLADLWAEVGATAPAATR